MPDLQKSTVVVSAEQLLALARQKRCVYNMLRCGDVRPIPAAFILNMQFALVMRMIESRALHVYEKQVKLKAWYMISRAEKQL